MEIVCLDLEGVLVPEIWIAFAEETGIPELKRTTRDEPDYDKLMKYRLNILRPVFIAFNIDKASSPRTSPTIIRSGRERNAALISSFIST